MIRSRLQSAVDAAWPRIEAVLKDATTRSTEAAALRDLKDAFMICTLPATATEVSVAGRWSIPTVTRVGVVRLDQRCYTSVCPYGLVELDASAEVSPDDLADIADGRSEAIAALVVRRDDADDLADGRASVIATLGREAVRQQLAYAMGQLLPGAIESGACTLTTVVAAARHALRATTGAAAADEAALTVITSHPRIAALTDAEKAGIRASLLGGTLIGIPGVPMPADWALVVRRRADDTTWYSARDIKPAWEPTASGAARISVTSRLLVYRSSTAWRYAASLGPTAPQPALAGGA